MTLNINDTRNGDDDHYCGPFRFINGATIKNLHVAGTLIKSHKKHAGGIVGKAYGTNNIIDCRVSATISTTSDGDGSHGGFLGDLRGGTTHFKSCLFDGQLIGTNTESWLKKRPVSAASQLTAMEPSQAQHFTTVASSIVTYSTPLKTKP